MIMIHCRLVFHITDAVIQHKSTKMVSHSGRGVASVNAKHAVHTLLSVNKT